MLGNITAYMGDGPGKGNWFQVLLPATIQASITKFPLKVDEKQGVLQFWF
jgi:hypothetical protein